MTENLEAAIVAALISNPNSYRTNTPVEVLAKHMVRSLDAFEWSLLERSKHPFFAPGKRNAP